MNARREAKHRQVVDSLKKSNAEKLVRKLFAGIVIFATTYQFLLYKSGLYKKLTDPLWDSTDIDNFLREPNIKNFKALLPFYEEKNQKDNTLAPE